MIVQNAAICKKCKDFIVSKHVHDFVECSCGAIFVDGGQQYLRRGGDLANIIDVSWSIEDNIYNLCADAVQDAIDSNRNKYGIANAVLRVLRNADRVIGEQEQRVFANSPDLEECYIMESNGAINRYKKVV